MGRYISKFYDSDIQTWTQAVVVEQVFMEEKLKFQFVMGEVNIHYCHTKHHFDISGGWVGLKNFVKMICCIAMWTWMSPLTFGAEILFESFLFLLCGSE